MVDIKLYVHGLPENDHWLSKRVAWGPYNKINRVGGKIDKILCNNVMHTGGGGS